MSTIELLASRRSTVIGAGGIGAGWGSPECAVGTPANKTAQSKAGRMMCRDFIFISDWGTDVDARGTPKGEVPPHPQPLSLEGRGVGGEGAECKRLRNGARRLFDLQRPISE